MRYTTYRQPTGWGPAVVFGLVITFAIWLCDKPEPSGPLDNFPPPTAEELARFEAERARAVAQVEETRRLQLMPISEAAKASLRLRQPGSYYKH